MITVPSMSVPSQEEFIALQKRVEVLEKQLGISKKKPAKKYPPLTLKDQQKAKAQIMPFLKNLPDGKMVSAWQTSQQTTLLRQLGTAKVREHLEQLVQVSALKKEGDGKSAHYCVNYSQEDQAARSYILAIKNGIKPDALPDAGKWTQCCQRLSDVYDDNPEFVEYVIAAFTASGKYPGLGELLS